LNVKPIYEVIPELSRDEVEAAAFRNDAAELRYAVLSVALYDADPEFAEAFCLKFSDHANSNVRSNALLGLSHVARIHGRLNESEVKPVIIAAMSDVDQDVRGQANDVKEDTEWYLKWRY
jgi:hypothetical protein